MKALRTPIDDMMLPAVVNSLIDPAICLDADGRVVALNAAAAEILDTPAGNAPGQPREALFSIVSIAPDAMGDDVLAPLLPLGGRTPMGAMLRLPGGRTAMVECAVSALTLAHGRFNLLILRPLAAFQERALRAVQDSEGKWRALVEHAEAMIYVKEVGGAFAYVNRAFCALFGLSPDVVNGRTEYEVLPPGAAALVRRREREAATSPSAITTEDEMMVMGTPRIVAATRFQIPHASRSTALVCCIGTEITALRAMESAVASQQLELARLARLNVAGEMASGIAHELNQPLSAALSFTQAAHTHLLRGSSTRTQIGKSLDSAAQQIMRAGEIIKRLRGFVQKGSIDLFPVDLNTVAAGGVQLMRHELERGNILLDLFLSQGPVVALGDRLQLEQVVINFLRNSIDALKSVDGRERRIQVTTEILPDGFGELRVEDNGPGIPAADMPKLLEPFFTTRPDGMGLGLSISRSIIERCGGQLSIENRDSYGLRVGFKLKEYAE